MLSGSRPLNRSLEALRGIAAVLVVVSHCRLYPYNAAGVSPSGRSMIESALLFPASFGRESVGIFFVLSGFLVAGQVVRQVSRNRFSAREFIVKRATRFWMVLIPGLVVTLGVDLVSQSIWQSETISQGRSSTSVGSFFCNSAFLMDNRCASFGTNDSLWSLGYEFWFYLLFAALAVSYFSAKRRQFVRSAIAALVAAACVAAYGVPLLALFPAWLLGAVAGYLSKHTRTAYIRDRSRQMVVVTGLIFVVGLGFSSMVDTLAWKYLLLGVSTSPLVLVLGVLDPEPRRLRRLRSVAVWIGTWSFTLYVFHLPFVMLAAVGVGSLEIPVSPLTPYALALVVIALVYPMFWLGEAYTDRVRVRLLQYTKSMSARFAWHDAVGTDELLAVAGGEVEQAGRPDGPLNA